MHFRTVCAAVSALLGLASAAVAQDKPEPVQLTPQMVLDDFRAGYRKEVVADEVRVTLRTPSGVVRSDRVVIRVDAAGVRPDDGARSLLLTLGSLSIWVGEGRVVATHEAEPGAAFVREIPGGGPIEPASLLEMLPPIPLPQLAAIAPDAAALSDPTPYTARVMWTGASLDAEARPPVATVTGTFAGWGGVGGMAGGPVVMAINGETGRLISFRADTTGPEGPVTMELASKPVDPGAPASWKIDPSGREVVTKLAELRTGRVPPVLKVGDAVPDVALLGPDLSSWSLHEALGSAGREHPPLPGEAGPAAPSAVIVLFRAERVGPGPMADAKAAAAVLRGLVKPGEPARFVSRAGVVIDLGEFSRDRFQSLRRQWAEGAPADADGLLWASSAAQTIDRFSREAAAVAVVVGPDRLLRSVVVLDGAEGAAAALEAALKGPATAPDEPAVPPAEPAGEPGAGGPPSGGG